MTGISVVIADREIMREIMRVIGVVGASPFTTTAAVHGRGLSALPPDVARRRST